MAATAAIQWQPQEEGFRELCGLLEQQISPSCDKSQIWQQLQHYSQFPDFNNYLVFILSRAQNTDSDDMKLKECRNCSRCFVDLVGELIEKDLILTSSSSLKTSFKKQYLYAYKLSLGWNQDLGDQVEIVRFIRERVKNDLKKFHDEAKEYLQTATGPKLSLLIMQLSLVFKHW